MYLLLTSNLGVRRNGVREWPSARCQAESVSRRRSGRIFDCRVWISMYITEDLFLLGTCFRLITLHESSTAVIFQILIV